MHPGQGGDGRGVRRARSVVGVHLDEGIIVDNHQDGGRGPGDSATVAEAAVAVSAVTRPPAEPVADVTDSREVSLGVYTVRGSRVKSISLLSENTTFTVSCTELLRPLRPRAALSALVSFAALAVTVTLFGNGRSTFTCAVPVANSVVLSTVHCQLA
eukprot:1840738-Pyramimonas_sp.AAC.2